MTIIAVLFVALSFFFGIRSALAMQRENKRRVNVLDKEYWQTGAILIVVAVPGYFLFEPVMNGLFSLHPVQGFGGVWAIAVGFLIVCAIIALIGALITKALGIQTIKPRDPE